jgi:uncharacterized protein
VRIVLDTNIYISALLSAQGATAKLVNAWLNDKFVLITSEEQLNELTRAANYDRLRPRIGREQAEELIETLSATALLVIPSENVNLSRDPDDNRIIATAMAGKANYLVTGDKRDLLSLKSAQSIPVITPRAMLELLNKTDLE